MSKIDTGVGSRVGGVIVKQRRADDILGVAFQTARSAAPTSSSDQVLYVRGTTLYFWNGSSETAIGAPGGAGAIPTWETLFAADATFNTGGTTFTIDNSSGNNDVLTITNTGAGSGDLIQITNAGTGKDIRGTSNTWDVTKAGVATFAGVSISGTASALVTTGAAVWTLLDASATALSIGASDATSMLVFDTSDGVEIVKVGNGFQVTSGLTTLIQASNTVPAVTITNNTITTYGVTQAEDAGVLVVRSTTITTGTLLRLQAVEGTFTTGAYIEALDTTGGNATVFKVSRYGATTILGTAAGTASLTQTNGDHVISSGALSVSRAGDAVNFTVTNNTATTASVAVITGSGIHTGTAATSFMTITQSGTTAGTILYVVGAGATDTVAMVDFKAAALTSGSLLRLTTSTAAFTTGGKALEVALVAATAGNGIAVTTTGAYAGTGLAILTAGAMTTGVGLSVISTTGLTSGSLIRATSSTAGAILTNGAISFVATGAFTSTAVTDGYVNTVANSTTAGTIASISGTALTTGVGFYVANSTSAMTTGSLVRVVASGTGTINTNGIVSIRHAGIFLSTSNFGVLDVSASALVGAGTVVNFTSTAASQTAAKVLNIDSSGYTTGYTGSVVTMSSASTTGTGNILQVTSVATSAGDAVKFINNAIVAGTTTILNVSHTTSVLGAGNSMVRITSTGVDTGTTTGVLLDLAATAATSATLALITSATLDSGKALVMNLNGLTTGAGQLIAHTTSVIANGGSLLRLTSTGVDTSTTTGSLFDLSSTAGAADTKMLATFAGNTTGIGMSVVATGTTQGVLYKATAAAATLTTGAYFQANDGGVNVFAIGLNGHIQSRQTTKPTIVVTQQNGITAAAITAGSTDTVGVITTTGTNNNGGTSILTVTFNKTYAIAPQVVIAGANAAGSLIWPYISSTTTTTFVVTIPASASSGATPSWYYQVLEMGS